MMEPEYAEASDRRTDGRTHTRTVRCRRLEAEEIGPKLIGRSVVYRDIGRAEIGTVTSYRGSTVWARYSSGDTAAGAHYTDLWLLVS